MPRVGMRASLASRVRLDYVMRNLRMGRVVIGGGVTRCEGILLKWAQPLEVWKAFTTADSTE